MKLYVWENVLTNYTDGIMFALADNLNEAKKAILENTPSWMKHNVERDLEKPYSVFDSPVGFSLYGGD